MNIKYKVTDNMEFEFEADTLQEVFKQRAQIDAVFGITKCPATGSTNLKYVLKEAGDNIFYEIHDEDNFGMMMQFGQRKGTLIMYPRKNKESGKVWFRWDSQQKEE